ncbi:MAG: hypothetical protein O7H41_15990 [Planctomycetota bacterium]|nr:hypothetical protein [Planctomycetota bacterium]
MTTSPKRAFLSLKSLMVMCAMFAAYSSLNVVDRHVGDWHRGERQLRRGFPLTYSTEERLIMMPSAEYRPPPWPTVRGARQFHAAVLVADFTIGLVASVLIALASERFVFSRMRRGPRPN